MPHCKSKLGTKQPFCRAPELPQPKLRWRSHTNTPDGHDWHFHPGTPRVQAVGLSAMAGRGVSFCKKTIPEGVQNFKTQEFLNVVSHRPRCDAMPVAEGQTDAVFPLIPMSTKRQITGTLEIVTQ